MEVPAEVVDVAEQEVDDVLQAAGARTRRRVQRSRDEWDQRRDLLDQRAVLVDLQARDGRLARLDGQLEHQFRGAGLDQPLQG